MLTDASGDSPATYAYSAFGSTRASTGSVANEVRFTGERTDTESGLEFLRARTYDPATGTFLSRDTWGITPTDSQSLGLYLYTQNDPADDLDPSGHCVQAAAFGMAVGPEGGAVAGAACVAVVTSGEWIPALMTVVGFLGGALGLKMVATSPAAALPATGRAAPGPSTVLDCVAAGFSYIQCAKWKPGMPLPTVPPRVIPDVGKPQPATPAEPGTQGTPSGGWPKNTSPWLNKVLKVTGVTTILSMIGALFSGQNTHEPEVTGPSPSPRPKSSSSPTPTPGPTGLRSAAGRLVL